MQISWTQLVLHFLYSEVDATAELKLAEEYGVRGQEFCVPVMFSSLLQLDDS